MKYFGLSGRKRIRGIFYPIQDGASVIKMIICARLIDKSNF